VELKTNNVQESPFLHLFFQKNLHGRLHSPALETDDEAEQSFEEADKLGWK